MNRYDKRRRVWITQPEPHGNGGWCGDKPLTKSMSLWKALRINPGKDLNQYQDWSYFGRLGATRISIKPDSNKAIYYWNGDEHCWKRQDGKDS